MQPYGTRKEKSRRVQHGKGGHRSYGALATGTPRYRRAARKRARRLGRAEAVVG